MKKSGNYSNNNSIYKDIVKKYYREIFNYCYVKLRYNKQDAEECTQETFMILLKKWKSLSSIDNIRGWLYRTSDNVMKNYNRKANRHRNELSPFNDAEYDTNLKFDNFATHTRDFSRELVAKYFTYVENILQLYIRISLYE